MCISRLNNITPGKIKVRIEYFQTFLNPSCGIPSECTRTTLSHDEHVFPLCCDHDSWNYRGKGIFLILMTALLWYIIENICDRYYMLYNCRAGICFLRDTFFKSDLPHIINLWKPSYSLILHLTPLLSSRKICVSYFSYRYSDNEEIMEPI